MSEGKKASSSSTVATSRRNAADRSSTGPPANSTVPAIGGSRPTTVCSTVDFPAPFGPMMPSAVPGATPTVTGAQTGSPP